MIDEESALVFRVEAQELLEQIEHGLLDLERTPDDMNIIAGLFRALHTLKGSGAMFGYDALAKLAHRCETAFDRIRKGKAKAKPELICAVLAALDHMRLLCDGGSISEEENNAVISILNEVDSDNGQEDSAKFLSEKKSSSNSTSAIWKIFMRFSPNALRNGTRPLVILDELRALGQAKIIVDTGNIPALTELQPSDCLLAWQVTLLTDRARAEIDEIFSFDAMSMELTVTKEAPQIAAPLPLVIPSTHTAETLSAQIGKIDGNKPITPVQQTHTPAQPAHSPSLSEETLRVPAQKLDALMDRLGELVIAQSHLRQVSNAISDINLDAITEDMERLTTSLRETMMSVRMVPVAQLFSRFRRLVHDLARETGKEIIFTISGESTELDKTIIERLSDPLIHLIRNAADHGIEPAEERRNAAKPEAGSISLYARQAGAEVIITIEDDGRGINRERVRAKAEANGLIAPGQVLGDEELLQLVFMPGFSTAQKVTGLSGRGVGMDVVKSAIESLRGSIGMQSTPGEGSRIDLRIPLTLAIIDGLLVRVAGSIYVIPLASIEECLEVPSSETRGEVGRNIITLRERIVPYLRLSEIFASPPNTDTDTEIFPKIVIVSTGIERAGLVVDHIIGDHQTVIKPLSGFHTCIGLFSGATILGDGSVALILDTSSLVAMSRNREERQRAVG